MVLTCIWREHVKTVMIMYVYKSVSRELLGTCTCSVRRYLCGERAFE